MAQLKILAGGSSVQAQAHARGKLFEKLMAEVLRECGYEIDKIPSVNYAGMEIDIEGKNIVTSSPLYAECKCQETEIDAPKLHQFFGKYMTRWLKNNHCQGLFIALPGVNSHAKGFYRENMESNREIVIRLLEEEQVLNTIYKMRNIVRSETIAGLVVRTLGTAGDSFLLYTEKGFFWVQLVIPVGSGIPDSIILFDSVGNRLTDKPTVEWLMQLYPEMNEFQQLSFSIDRNAEQTPRDANAVEEIVEVRGSSSCFEYQFPASPEFFVGRADVFSEVDSFVKSVMDKETSSRGLLFEANSGWGKSSVVLSSVARLEKLGHYAIAIDCRSASSSQFILHVINYVVSKLHDAGVLEPTIAITGFEGATKALLDVGEFLKNNGKLLLVFLDQFENVFFLQDALKRIRDIFLKVSDVQTNVIFGFSWKTDLIGLTNEFPYQLRDTIRQSAKVIPLHTFSEIETNALLDKLSRELRAPLRKDLRFFLSEFSQGYPWLLKKLCAHVKAQREAGVPQADIANSLLNVEELFQEDLRGLTGEEDDALHRIAKNAPIGVSELGEEYSPDVLQSLVDRRLIVRIGNKYDIYWDIFRDYLNSSKLPVQENYILHMHVGSLLKVWKLLAEAKDLLTTAEIQQLANLSEKSFLNLARDMKLLGIAKVEAGRVGLQVPFLGAEAGIGESARVHLRDRLRRNRLISRILEELEINNELTMREVADILARSCPYISAKQETWQVYASTFADWMNITDLSILDRSNSKLTRYRTGSEVRERGIVLAKRRGGVAVPPIQYSPIEKAAVRIVEALGAGSKINWAGFRKSTIAKCLVILEDLGFIVRKTQAIEALPKCRQFVSNPEQRPTLFAEGALRMHSFAALIDLLTTYQKVGRTISQLGKELRVKLNVEWTDDTATTNAKIMLDWARHTALAPGVFAQAHRGARSKDQKSKQMKLFPGR